MFFSLWRMNSSKWQRYSEFFKRFKASRWLFWDICHKSVSRNTSRWKGFFFLNGKNKTYQSLEITQKVLKNYWFYQFVDKNVHNVAYIWEVIFIGENLSFSWLTKCILQIIFSANNFIVKKVNILAPRPFSRKFLNFKF